MKIDRDKVSELWNSGRNKTSHPLTRDPDLSLSLIRDRGVDNALNLAHLLSLDVPGIRLVILSLACKKQSPKILDIHDELAKHIETHPTYEIPARIQLSRERDFNAFAKHPAVSAALWTSLLQEGFFPDLRQSWARLGLYGFKGAVGNATLLSPSQMKVETESDGITTKAADFLNDLPPEILGRGYDLVFPTTAVALGSLRKNCQAWRTDRWLRRYATLPFTCPSFNEFTEHDRQKLQQFFRVKQLYALLPAVDLWSKPFQGWSESDWQHPENLSALFDLAGNTLLWATGSGSVDWIRQVGISAADFFRQ